MTRTPIGRTALLDPCVARVIRDLPAELISLKIGANIVGQAAMRQRTVLPAVHGFLDTVRDGHPSTPIVVISPTPSPASEDLPGPTILDPVSHRHRATGSHTDISQGALTTSAVRRLLEQLVSERRNRDEALHYQDGRSLLRPDEVNDLHDGLRPNADAYVRMGHRFANQLADQDWLIR